MRRGSTSSFFATSSIPAGWPACSVRRRACPPDARSVAAASALNAVGTASVFAADERADLILRGGMIRPLPGAPVSSARPVRCSMHRHEIMHPLVAIGPSAIARGPQR